MGRKAGKRRPKYETKAHHKQERDFIGYLEGVFKCNIFKVPHRYKVDAIGVRGEAETGVFWFELKQRRKRWDPYMISVRKLWSGVELARATKCPSTCACGSPSPISPGRSPRSFSGLSTLALGAEKTVTIPGMWNPVPSSHWTGWAE